MTRQSDKYRDYDYEDRGPRDRDYRAPRAKTADRMGVFKLNTSEDYYDQEYERERRRNKRRAQRRDDDYYDDEDDGRARAADRGRLSKTVHGTRDRDEEYESNRREKSKHHHHHKKREDSGEEEEDDAEEQKRAQKKRRQKIKERLQGNSDPSARIVSGFDSPMSQGKTSSIPSSIQKLFIDENKKISNREMQNSSDTSKSGDPEKRMDVIFHYHVHHTHEGDIIDSKVYKSPARHRLFGEALAASKVPVTPKNKQPEVLFSTLIDKLNTTTKTFKRSLSQSQTGFIKYLPLDKYEGTEYATGEY